jgi:6-phosphogluconate dehydrogenase (decarboxylating)
MKTQIEKLIVLARNIADAHMGYNLVGEMVTHTHNVRIHQLNADKENEFTTVYLTSGGKEFKVNFSNYRGVTLEFQYATNIEEVLDTLINDVEESLVDWFVTYLDDMVRIREEAIEKRKQMLIQLTNEINQMEGNK